MARRIVPTLGQAVRGAAGTVGIHTVPTGQNCETQSAAACASSEVASFAGGPRQRSHFMARSDGIRAFRRSSYAVSRPLNLFYYKNSLRFLPASR